MGGVTEITGIINNLITVMLHSRILTNTRLTEERNLCWEVNFQTQEMMVLMHLEVKSTVRIILQGTWVQNTGQTKSWNPHRLIE